MLGVFIPCLGMDHLNHAVCAEGLVCVQVVQGTIRDLANHVFAHLHRLDLKFHLSRQTGAINRITDRGSRGINFILSSMVTPLPPPQPVLRPQVLDSHHTLDS